MPGGGIAAAKEEDPWQHVLLGALFGLGNWLGGAKWFQLFNPDTGCCGAEAFVIVIINCRKYAT